jgi:hypothetical protein
MPGENVILTVEDLAEEPKINLFGQTFNMMVWEDFSPFEQVIFFKILAQVRELNPQNDDIDVATAQRTSELLDDFLKLVIPDLPDEIAAKLRNRRKKKLELFTNFIQAAFPGQPQNALAPEQLAAPPPPTEKPEKTPAPAPTLLTGVA